MKIIKKLLITNIFIILLFLAICLSIYLCESFIAWKFIKYDSFGTNEQIRVIYLWSLGLSIFWRIIVYIYNHDKDDPDFY